MYNEEYIEDNIEPKESAEDLYRYIKFITSSGDVPDNLKSSFWAFFNKNIVLGNISEREKGKLLNRFDLTVLTEIMSHPRAWLTSERTSQLENLRSFYELQLSRAVGGFERRMEATQISQVIRSTENMEKEEKKGTGGAVRRIFR